MKIFVDDQRTPDSFSNYQCARSYKTAVMLLDIFKEVDVINLDYDLGSKET